jgi:hypothetical protein
VKGRAVLAAYRDTGASEIACPHCDARAGQPCTKSDGRISRVPCVGRLAAADIGSTAVAPLRGATVAHDYSEPRHPQEES